MSKFETLTIDDAGTQFAFLDSGIPEATADSYATIFVVHGIVFTSRTLLSRPLPVACFLPNNV